MNTGAVDLATVAVGFIGNFVWGWVPGGNVIKAAITIGEAVSASVGTHMFQAYKLRAC